MNLHDSINRIFTDNRQTQQMAVAMLSDAIANAALLITQSLLSGGKVLCHGNGMAALIAQQFGHNMLAGQHAPRPALPAIVLDGSTVVATRSLSALSQHHDILLLSSLDSNDSSTHDLVDTAHTRELHIIALTGGAGEGLSELLRPHDIEIRVPADNMARTMECQHLIVNCLGELIDQQLLGQ